MKVEISGSRCVSCYKYTQYYRMSMGEAEAIDRGWCSARQCTTRPGNRCKHYREMANVGR